MIDLAKVVIWAEDKTRDGVQSAQRGLQGLGNEVDGFKAKFAALGGLLGVTAFAAIVKSHIDELAALRNLQEAYGATAENLSLLREAHKLAGHDMSELGGVLGRLSKNMIESLDQYSKQREALNALGVSAVDAAGKLKSPDQVLIELGRNLGNYRDGAQKVAALQAVLGKEAARYIPVLNELAIAEQYRVKLTDGQLKAADELSKNQVRLTASTRAWWTLLSAELAPALNDVYKMLLGLQNETSGMRNKTQQLAADGSLRDWFRTIVLWVGYGIDGLQYFARGIQTIGIAIGSASASMDVFGALMQGISLILTGKFSLGVEIVKTAMDKMKAGVGGALDDIATLWRKPVFSDSVEKAMYGAQATVKKATGDMEVSFSGAAEGTRKLDTAYASLLSQLGSDIAKLQFEIDYFEKYGTAAESAAEALIMFKIANSELSLFDPRTYAALVLAIRKDMLARAKKDDEDFARAKKASDEKILKDISDQWKERDRSVRETTLSLQAELQQIGADFIMSEKERSRYLLEIKAEEYRRIISIAREGTEDKKKLEEAYIAWYEAKQRSIDFSEWKKNHDELANGLTDAIMRGFEAGKSIAKNFRDLLVNTFKTLVLKPIIQPIASGGAGMLLQLLGVGGAAAAGALGGVHTGSLGALSSLIPGGASGIMGSGALTGAGDFIGSGLAGFAGDMALAMGATDAFAASLAAAVPVVGWIAAAGMMLYSIFGKSGGGPKSGGSFVGGFSASGSLSSDLTSGLDRSRHLHDETGMDAEAARIAETYAAGFAQTLSTFGIKAGFQLGVGFNRDTKGDAPSMVSSLLRDSTGRTLLEQVNRNVGREDKDVETEIALQESRALLALLQATAGDLDETVRSVINSLDVGTASQTAIENGLKLAAAVKGLVESLSPLSAEDLVQQSQRSAMARFREQGNALSQLARDATLSADSIQNLTAATNQYRGSAAQLILQYEEARKSIESTIGDAIRGFKLAGLDKQGQYNFLQAEASQLAGGIMGLDDAAAIAETVRNITQLSNQAFGMLSEEERAAKSAEFIKGLEEVRRAADERLRALQTQTEDAANRQLAEMGTQIRALTSKLDLAVTNFAGATDKFVSGVERGADVRIDFRADGLVAWAGGSGSGA